VAARPRNNVCANREVANWIPVGELKFFIDLIHLPNFMKLCPVGLILYHANERTDMTILTVVIRDFAKAPKI
jgi:hypothetical protein